MKPCCVFIECEKEVKAKQLCNGHYQQAWAGKVLTPLTTNGFGIDRRSPFRRAVEDGGDVIAELKARTRLVNGCWEWLGHHSESGYPVINWQFRLLRVHRIVHSAVTGEALSPDLSIHHVCANRSCVNPDHLQAVTQLDNNIEMLERRHYKSRIQELEAALRELSADHPLLEQRQMEGV